MMSTKLNLKTFAIMVSYCAIAGAGVLAETGAAFQRGHVFVSVREPEACDFGGREWIVEIDPESGVWSVFADSDDGLCLVSGLRFTPDGSRLLALNYGHFFPNQDGGWVMSFAPDGTGEIILDETDGLAHPYGTNAMAFDPSGNFYIFSGGSRKLLVFPADGSAAWIFADSSDGVWVNGALDFSPNGRLYFTGFSGVMWFTPDGESHVLDPVGSWSLTVDRYGAIYVGGGGELVRYELDDAGTAWSVISGLYLNVIGIASPDGAVVYAIDTAGGIFEVDWINGTSTLLADVGSLTDLSVLIPVGITVHSPVVVCDVDADGDVDLRDFAIFGECLEGPGYIGRDVDCRFADADLDGDLDLVDYGIFQNAYRVMN